MKPHITIIDDDQEFVDMLKQVIEDAGFTVTTYSFTGFVNLLEQDPPNVILLDVWFDRYQSGLDLARAIKSRASLAHVPMILMSCDLDVIAHSQEIGADSYLAKPFEVTELVDVLKTVIN